MALVATSAFADVSWGAWCRTGLDLVSVTGTADPVMQAFPSWAKGNRVGLSFSGSAAEFGFNLNVDTNGGQEIAVGDQAKLWWKPASFLKMEIGKVQVDTLRGGASSMNFDSYGAGGEDNIFQRLYPKAGLAIELTPIDGLFFGYAVDSGAASYTTPTDLVDDLTCSQVQVGYTIKDVAMIRAQYIGALSTAQNYLQIAGKVLALGSMGISADIGAKIPLNNASGTLNTPYLIEGYVHYAKDALTARIRATANIAAETGYYSNVGVYAMGMYKIIPLLSAGLSGSFQSDTTTGTAAADSVVKVAPFIRFNAAGGTVALAVEDSADLTTSANNKLRIPLIFEAGF